MADGNSTQSCANCPYDTLIEELRKDSERNSNQHREFYKRFSDNEKAQAISDERYNNILSVVNKIDSTLTELKDKPGKRWDNISTYVITCLVGLILGYLFNVALHL